LSNVKTISANGQSFSAVYDLCPEGRLFDKYPDQIKHCRVIEYFTNPEYQGLWTTCAPDFYKAEIFNKGYNLGGIEAYTHKSWKKYRGKYLKVPAFTELQNLDELQKSKYTASNVKFTGLTHFINGQIFYEINLIRNIDGGREIENPFTEIVDEVLREAENLLRKRHGIPLIGEGWVSETQLYRLIQRFFPDAKQHASPTWLRPQHLDIFVLSKNLAFEYQGKQHFEPVDFFGGQNSFENTVKRDKLKAQKCKINKITLIEWLHTEPINESVLMEKLKRAKVTLE